MHPFCAGVSLVVVTVCLAVSCACAARAPEDVYRGDLVAYPGPWAFELGKSGIILVSDRQLEMLADPDAKVDLSLTFDKHEASLRQVCEGAKAAGQRTLAIAFDHFFSQYRPGQAGPRKYTPDMDSYISRIGDISRFASQYGLGLELSLLSPLEVGPGWCQKTGEPGVWMHYRKGIRDTKTGAYSVQLWQQFRWANNKGPVDLKDAGVRVFTYQETPVPGSCYLAVDPASIVEITDTAKVERWKDTVSGGGDYRARRIRVYGRGRTDLGPRDRVLVVQSYQSPEMDYFSPRALPFLKDLIDRYTRAGVKLNGLYSDEMHIQQDWAYFSHHDNGEFAMRYVSPGLAQRFAELYGPQYKDFAKYLVYFAYGQEDTSNNLVAKAGTCAVFGASPEDVRRTALFRARYYHLLQNGVTDLFTQAKHYAEDAMGHRLEARAHATWAESPTCDFWRWNGQSDNSGRYEYTSNFVWSNTVQQAAAACADYFKWGDFLTGNGNDHAECGWLDRDYLGLALACSTGILNEVPYSYCAHWGMPDEVARRRTWLVNAYGCGGSLHGIVQGMVHRDVDVLMLYPLDLVAEEERFGSWVAQYGYANLITAEKLLERGSVSGGSVEAGGRRFHTLIAGFEPFPSHKLLRMMREMAEGGGRVIWSGPPPVIGAEGDSVLKEWTEIFGVDYAPGVNEGLMAPGAQVTFAGALAGVDPQIILTDFLVDHIYPLTPRDGTAVAAHAAGHVVATCRKLPGGGLAVALGYRPRDDQSASLGYQTRNWFQVLCALGAYAPTGRSNGVNDNTEYVSRTTGYLACRFPNGAVSIAPHLCTLPEEWPGGFARNREEDLVILKRLNLPPEELHLQDFRVNGHSVTFNGLGTLSFRLNGEGILEAFSGANAQEITVDGHQTVYCDHPLGQVTWGPVPEDRRVPGGAVMQIRADGAGTLRVPAPGLPAAVKVFVEGPAPGSRGAEVPCHLQDGVLSVQINESVTVGRWLYVTPAGQ